MANWKDAYKDQWKISNEKEELVRNSLASTLNCEIIYEGLGAGSTEYIAKEDEPDSHKKGDADLYIKEADAYVEVTGPNVQVYYEAGLWIRPDKITNAEEKIKNGVGKLHFIIHVTSLKEAEGATVFRVIELNEKFFNRVRNNEFEIVNPIIRGNKEEFYEIPHDDVCIKDYHYYVGFRVKPLIS